MRQAVSESKKHRARGVSLPPDMEKRVLTKIGRLEMGFSRYVQRIIDFDLRNNILGEILAEEAKRAA